MGWWIRQPQVAPGDHVMWSVYANREKSALRYVGGRLLVTEDQVIFQPNRFDSNLGGEVQRWQLSDVRAVDAEPRRLTLPFFGLAARNRKRLRITMSTGQVELFVINHVDTAIEYLRSRTSSRTR
jgi:hypothetical protein